MHGEVYEYSGVFRQEEAGYLHQNKTTLKNVT